MIPIRDGIPTRQTPVVNYMLIAANILVFLWMFLMPESALETMVNDYAMVPAHFVDGVTLADIMTIFTSMFMHAGLAHIGGFVAGMVMVKLMLTEDRRERGLTW